MALTVPLAHDVVGRGPPWVFLHGFPLTRALWAPQRALAADARLVLPDLRGFGSSPVAPAATMEEMAADVAALMDRLGHRTFGVVGLSMGGYVALALLRAAPERVAALALVDTQARADTPEAAAKREVLAQRIQAEGVDAAGDAFLPKLLAPANRARLLDPVAAMIRANRPAGLAAALRGMAARADARTVLGEARCPVLVVVGAEDELTPPPRAEEMASLARGSRLVVLPGAGHLASLEAPDAFRDALRPFLAPAPR